MSPFGRHGQPRLVHLKSRREAGALVFTWDVRHTRALRWRVLRSDHGPAAGPFDNTVAGSGQTLVTDQPAPGSRDDHVLQGATYFYTVFAEDERGRWHRTAKLKIAADDPKLGRRAEGDFEDGGPRPGSVNPHAVDITQSASNPGHLM